MTVEIDVQLIATALAAALTFGVAIGMHRGLRASHNAWAREGRQRLARGEERLSVLERVVDRLDERSKKAGDE